MQEDSGLYIRIISNTIKGLSSEGSEQIEFYPDFVPTSDELALTFESALPLIRELVSEKVLTEEILGPVENINEIFTKLSFDNSSTFWEDDGLLNDDRWVSIRQEARRILNILGPKIGMEPFDPSLS